MNLHVVNQTTVNYVTSPLRNGRARLIENTVKPHSIQLDSILDEFKTFQRNVAGK